MKNSRKESRVTRVVTACMVLALFGTTLWAQPMVDEESQEFVQVMKRLSAVTDALEAQVKYVAPSVETADYFLVKARLEAAVKRAESDVAYKAPSIEDADAIEYYNAAERLAKAVKRISKEVAYTAPEADRFNGFEYAGNQESAENEELIASEKGYR